MEPRRIVSHISFCKMHGINSTYIVAPFCHENSCGNQEKYLRKSKRNKSHTTCGRRDTLDGLEVKWNIEGNLRYVS